MALLFSSKTLLILATLVGMAICSAGVGQVAARGNWLHPLSMIAYLLGGLILVIVAAALLGIQLPWIDSPRAALMAVIILVIVKIALTQMHHTLVP